jgi:hypothetical protein
MDEIDIGMDIEFFLYGTRYNISWRDDKPFICTCPDGDATFYNTPKEMLERYKVKNKPLKDIWRDIEILFM